ncbi:hypothetical protein [Methylosinus sp. LW4]|uniref:hypothetical protein n=1 Tax=Methylosinus sp. LW4 TaxID=136993 RepID=UPI0012F78CC8|nr:hypothetical protein [Methylosinus sp. LW4]
MSAIGARRKSDALRTEVEAKGVFVSLVVLGLVESSYWEHNPGSREHASKAISPLTTDQAGAVIIQAIEQRKRVLVSPAIFRALFLLRALYSCSTGG